MDEKIAAARELVALKRSQGWDYLLWSDLSLYSDSTVIQTVESLGWCWGENFQRWFFQMPFYKEKPSVALMVANEE